MFDKVQKKYNCQTCNKEFKSRSEQVRCQSKHGIEGGTKEGHQCKCCGYTAVRKEHLEKHFKSKKHKEKAGKTSNQLEINGMSIIASDAFESEVPSTSQNQNKETVIDEISYKVFENIRMLTAEPDIDRDQSGAYIIEEISFEEEYKDCILEAFEDDQISNQVQSINDELASHNQIDGPRDIENVQMNLEFEGFECPRCGQRAIAKQDVYIHDEFCIKLNGIQIDNCDEILPILVSKFTAEVAAALAKHIKNSAEIDWLQPETYY